MKILYWIKIKFDKENSKDIHEVQKFTNLYKHQKAKYGYKFNFDELSELKIAISILQSNKLAFEYFMKIRPDSTNTIDEFPGYLIGLPAYYNLIKDNKVDNKIFKKHNIVKCLSDNYIYVTRDFKSILDDNTNSIIWEEILDQSGNIFYKLTSTDCLKHPLIMMETREIKANTLPVNTKTFSLLSDGRIFINSENQNSLNNSGFASYNNIKVKDRNYPILERFIISVELMKVLIELKITDIVDSIFPVLDEEHELKDFNLL